VRDLLRPVVGDFVAKTALNMASKRIGKTAETLALSDASPSCRTSGLGGYKCFCDTCDDAAATPCGSDAECVAVGATRCGGRRCLGGAVHGTPCTTSADCGGAPCGTLSSTAPNSCNDLVCTPTSDGRGQCTSGPVHLVCGPFATFRGCGSDLECSAFRSCRGGANEGGPCAGGGDCPGGTCEPETCSVLKFRSCYPDNGVVGTRCFGGTNDGAACSVPADCPDGFCGGGSVSVPGTASVPAASEWDVTLASMPSCLPPRSASAENSIIGLPGLLRHQLSLHVRALP